MFAKWIFNAENNRSVKYVCKHDFQFEFKCQVQFKSHNADRCILDVFHFSSVLKTITIHPRVSFISSISHLSEFNFQFFKFHRNPSNVLTHKIDSMHACMHMLWNWNVHYPLSMSSNVTSFEARAFYIRHSFFLIIFNSSYLFSYFIFF